MDLRTMTSSALLLVVACRPGDGPASSFGNDPHAVPVSLIRFRTDSTAFAQYSGINQAQNFVIRDAAAWNDLWQRIYATQTPVPPPPDVDFNTQMVVASALGPGPRATDLLIREIALPYGLVDVKVCAVDEVWSGLKLVRRRELRR